MTTIRFDGLDKVNRELKSIKNRIRNLKPFYSKAKFIMFKDVIKHFKEEQSPAGTKWKPLKAATIKARRTRKDKPRKSTKILQDTGALRRVTKQSDDKGAIVGTNLKYARTHNFGDRKRGIPKREFMWLSNRAGKNILKLMESHITR